MLTIITPTGERPTAFALCEKQMQRQTYSGDVRWIIVDDGEVETPITFKKDGWTVDVIRPQPFWRPGENTQGRNLLAALERVEGDSVLTVAEDDDWYDPQWLSHLESESEKAELVGEGNAVYYNVHARKWRRLQNYEHASLRCTAMRGRAIETFREVLKTPNRYYDLRLWARHENKRVFSSEMTVGIKGMPGRPGIAVGHDGLRGNKDPSGDKLRELIGDEAEWYLQFYEENAMSTRKPIVVRPFRYNRRDWKVGEVFEAQRRIDVELHVHNQKVEWRTIDTPPVRTEPKQAPRTMKVETQEEKLASASVEKAVESGATEENKEDAGAEDVEDTEEDKPSGGFGRRRKRKAATQKDD